MRRKDYVRTFDCDALPNMKLSGFLIAPCLQMVSILVLTLLYVRRQEYVSKDDGLWCIFQYDTF